MKKPKMIYLKWLDHASGNYAWTHFKDVDNEKLFCESVGYLVKEDKDFYYVANSKYEDNRSCVMVMQVMKSAVIKKKILKL